MASPRICSVPDCSKRHYARGYCIAHYERHRRHGDALGGGTSKGAIPQWLAEHISYDGDECLIWPFSRNRTGYGTYQSPNGGTNAHRYMCVLAHGAPPTPRHEAAHTCGNGHLGCVHPGHLRWATLEENKADMVDHDTHHRGERHHGAKLTENHVRSIRAMKGKATLGTIAEKFGVSRALVCLIHNRKAWGWLD